MPRRMHSRAVAVAALAALELGGCGGPRLVPVEPSGVDLELAFPLVVDASGEPASVFAPFPIAAGRVVASGPVRVPVRLDGQALFLVGVNHSDLAREIRELDPSHPEEIRILIEAPPAQVEPMPGGNVPLSRRKLPDATPLLVLEEDTEPAVLREANGSERAVLKRLSLVLPVDPDPCPAEGVLKPFASQAEMFPGSEDGFATDLIRVARLDDDRVLALSPHKLYLFRRSDPPGQPTAVAEITAAGTGYNLAAAMAVEERADGSTHAVIAGATTTCADPARCRSGVVLETTVRGDAIEPVTTATIVAERRLFDVTIDPEGRVIAAGERAAVVSREPAGAAFRLLPGFDTPVIEGEPGAIEDVLATGDPQRPHFAAGPNRLFLGDLSTGNAQVLERIELPVRENVHFRSIACGAAPDPECWAASRSVPPRVYTRAPGAARFEELSLVLPESYRRCVTQAGTTVEIQAIALTPDAAFVATACNALLRVRRSPDHCTAAIAVEGSERIEPTHPDLELRSVDSSGGWITVAGERGTLLEMRVP